MQEHPDDDASLEPRPDPAAPEPAPPPPPPVEPAPAPSAEADRRPPTRLLLLLLVGAAGATFAVAALLISVFQHKVEARTPYVRLVEVDEATTDPAPWAINWPRQYDSYRRTVDTAETERGGSSAMPAQKLDAHPWLRRLYAGYAFSIDYREARGHAYMLADQEATRRVTERSQPGACLHCHASVLPTWRRIGAEALGQPTDAETLAQSFDLPAVEKGFELLSVRSYEEAHAELTQTPDGHGEAQAHPVSCVDCHDPQTLAPRVTRPGFLRGIAALAAGDAPVPHLPSIQRWREGDRSARYDPNSLASRQEMRTFVCGQCHVEYYCGPKEPLFFPWDRGLKVEDIEATLDAHTFPDGGAFYDWKHAETGARVYKAQHPEFELWSQGIHARSGVSCADCHMPYQREGAHKVSSHWVRSPLLTVNSSCQGCHQVAEGELLARVEAIQARTRALRERAGQALVDMLDALRAAKAAGASEEALSPLLELQRKAAWRLDFVSSENSEGFHADQESARILAESIDYARQAQAGAAALRAPEPPQLGPPPGEVHGVTPAVERGG